MEKQFSLLQAELISLKEELTFLDADIQEQKGRPPRINEELANGRRSLLKMESDLKDLRFSRESPPVTEARQAALQAGRQERMKEIAMLNRELTTYAVRLQLLMDQRELAARRLQQAQDRIRPYEEVMKERIQAEVEKTRRMDDLADLLAADKPPAIRRLAGEIIQGRKRLTEIAEETQRQKVILEALQAQGLQLEQDFRNAEQVVEVGGLGKTLGSYLLDRLQRWPDTRRYEKENRRLEIKIGDIWLEQSGVEEAQRALTDLGREIQRILDTEGDPGLPAGQRQEMEKELNPLLREKKAILGRLSEANIGYLTVLRGLQGSQRHFFDLLGQYRRFLESKLLWVPSAPPLGGVGFREASRAFGSLLTAAKWGETLKALALDLARNPFLAVPALGGIAILFWSRRRMRLLLGRLGKRSEDPATDHFSLTLQSLLLTLLLSMALPLFLAFLGWRLQEGAENSDFIRSVGTALWGIATPLFFLQALYHLCLPGGLAEAHFGWSKEVCRKLHRGLSWYQILFIAAGFFIALFWSVEEGYRGRGGRLLLMALLIAAAYLFYRVMPRAQETSGGSPRKPSGSWMDRLRKIGFPLAVGIPIFLAALVAGGYYYTAVRFLNYAHSSFWLLIGAAVIHELAVRWLEVSASRKGGAESPPGEGEGGRERSPSGAPGPVAPVGGGICFPSEGKEACRLIDALIGLGAVIGLLFVWVDIVPILSTLKQVHFWSQAVTVAGKEIQEAVSLYDLIVALILAGLLVVFTRTLPSILEIALLKRLPISAGSRYAVITLTRYSIIFIGLIAFFSVLGGSWSKIQWLVAALSVGLGFGLQEIVANFICGIIVLFEQPIRVGDTVTIGQVSGKVSRIHMRATIITDWDNKEVIIPNKTFITGQIVNWTLTEPVTRLSIRVGIAYGSDTALAHRVILDTVKAHPVVMTQPEPKVYFIGFAESALDFTAYFFVRKVADRLQVTHELYLAIERALREQGITIPFPQREVHIRSAAPEAWPDSGPAKEKKTGPG